MEQKPIPNFPGIYVTASGKILSDRSGVPFERALSVGPGGYLRVAITDDSGRAASKYVHRLVAEAFVNNPYGGSDVSHINGNKLDNRAENLVWTKRKDNLAKTLAPNGVWKIGGKNRIPVKETPIDKNLPVRHWESATAAARANGNKSMAANISTAIQTGRQAYGSYWSREDIQQ